MKYLNTYLENINDDVVVITDIPMFLIPEILPLVKKKYNVNFPSEYEYFIEDEIWMMISLTEKEIVLDDKQTFHHCWAEMIDINTYVSKYKDYYITCEDWLKQEFNIDINPFIQANKRGLY